MIRIAVDAMGGDYAPAEIVKGAVDAARRYNIAILLVGRREAIEGQLVQLNTQGLSIDIVEASEVIEMDESPATALRKKKDASIIVTARCVKAGNRPKLAMGTPENPANTETRAVAEADGMVACGSTGAAMASALLYIGRQKGVDRPAIGVSLPTATGTPCLLIDGGANAECTPEMLLQFAHMGQVYLSSVYKIPKPRVGLLNIGEEEGKGNAMVNAVYPLLKEDKDLNFIGNIEGRDLFRGTVEVAVCDGFMGNIALKSAEGVATMLLDHLKKEFTKDLKSKLIAALAKPILKGARDKVHPDERGGALLFGINGVCVIAHGSSKAWAVVNAIRVAKEAVETGVLPKIQARLNQELGASTPSVESVPESVS